MAGPGFDLGGGGVDFVKVLKVEEKVIFLRVLATFLLKLCLKLIASEEKLRKISVLNITNHMSAVVRGGGSAPGAPPPPGSANVDHEPATQVAVVSL